MKRNQFLIPLSNGERFWRYFLSLMLSAIFIVAGFSKLANLHVFAEDIMHFRIIPDEWSIIVASCLPYLEIMIGAAVFFKPIRLSASLMMCGLMFLFTLIVASALVRGLDVSCGCFGKTLEEYAGSGLMALIRDLVLLSACTGLLWLMLKDEVRNISELSTMEAAKKSGGHTL